MLSSHILPTISDIKNGSKTFSKFEICKVGKYGSFENLVSLVSGRKGRRVVILSCSFYFATCVFTHSEIAFYFSTTLALVYGLSKKDSMEMAALAY